VVLELPTGSLPREGLERNISVPVVGFAGTSVERPSSTLLAGLSGVTNDSAWPAVLESADGNGVGPPGAENRSTARIPGPTRART
jgi:hypothetical protein